MLLVLPWAVISVLCFLALQSCSHFYLDFFWGTFENYFTHISVQMYKMSTVEIDRIPDGKVSSVSTVTTRQHLSVDRQNFFRVQVCPAILRLQNPTKEKVSVYVATKVSAVDITGSLRK
jgi:hypothetical protein